MNGPDQKHGLPQTRCLSVVIPVYGRGPHLDRVVAALRAQTLPVGEIIISHSGTDDPTPRFARESGVTVLHSPERLYAGAARNRGLDNVTTEWVAFIDEDIIVDPDWHMSLLEVIAERRADCIVGAIDYAESGGYWGLCQWIVEFSALHSYMTERYVHGGASANMSVKVEAFRATGAFPEDLRMGQDTMSQALFRSAGHKIWFASRAVGRHINLAGFRRMIRHNLMLGKHAAKVRRLRPDLPGGVAARWPILSPGLWLARLALIYGRVFLNSGPVGLFLRQIPGVIIALIVHNVAFSFELIRGYVCSPQDQVSGVKSKWQVRS